MGVQVQEILPEQQKRRTSSKLMTEQLLKLLHRCHSPLFIYVWISDHRLLAIPIYESVGSIGSWNLHEGCFLQLSAQDETEDQEE